MRCTSVPAMRHKRQILVLTFLVAVFFFGHEFNKRTLIVFHPEISEQDSNSSNASNVSQCNETLYELKLFNILMKERTNRVRLVCNEMRGRGTIPPNKDFNKIQYMKEKQLYWCPIRKVGSTTWINYLLKLYPKMTEVQ